MKRLSFSVIFMLLVVVVGFSQKEAKLTVEVSNDSVLLGNYIEVKFTIENAEVQHFEAPNFTGFNIVSGPNQSTSMMISNGEVTQSVAYSYYLEPVDVGNYFIQPAFVDTDKGALESIPMEVLVVDNPDGIIQQPLQNKRKDFFNRDDFWGNNDFFDNHPFFNEIKPDKSKEKSKKKKKRKVYKL